MLIREVVCKQLRPKRVSRVLARELPDPVKPFFRDVLTTERTA